MIKLAALAVLLTLSALAQGPAPDRKIVEVKHLKGPRLDQAVRLVHQFLLPGDAQSFPELNSVVLRGSPEAVAAAEALLKKFDLPTVQAGGPTQSYMLRIYLVQGLDEAGQNGGLPADVNSAVEQMKKTFPFRSYRLLETILLPGLQAQMLQGQNGRGPEASGIIPHPAIAGATYQVRVQEILPTEEGKTVQLRRFSFVIMRPSGTNPKGETTWARAQIETDLTVRVGQKLVVGKLSVQQDNSAVFLIITAEPAS